MSAAATQRKTFALSMKYIIYASPEKLFETLTKESLISEWCDGGGKMEPKVDGNFELFDGWVKGKVVVFDPKKKVLSYTWKPGEWDKKTANSVVTWQIKPNSAGSEIQLDHTGFPSQEEADKHYDGWIDYVFEPLNDYFIR
ncbi:MAG: SRPBCC domain-containing protein [Bacteroidetes bacterium]|nr:SRPBCC domain-containing protein [Bacteroidota bacterium]MBK9422660.1 SRPBCC domain-containing protein [Bacteroidota bacterium]